MLVESLNRHHPEAKVCVWLLDDGEYPPLNCNARFRNVREVLQPDELESLRLYYNVLELATSLKPRLMKAHLGEGADRAVYMDPDIAVFRPLQRVFDLLNGGTSAVFTPHFTQPLPQDGHKPNDLEILTSGTYNLGFLAVAACAEVQNFLSWWDHWLKTYCFSDKSKGVFTDQKWAEFGPSLLKDGRVLHDTAYNVAYWNLHYRELVHSEAGWTVNGQDLCFFHFSGFNPKTPDILSKHQTRFSVLPEAVARLLKWYAGKVLASGHEALEKIPLPNVQFSNGIKVDIGVRAQFQKLILCGKKFVAPLDAKGAFYQWLLRPADVATNGGSPVITNYLKGVYDVVSRERQIFPDVMGRHKHFFLKWIRTSGWAEMGLSKTLVFHEPNSATKLLNGHQTEPDSRGVNYFGYLGSRLGIGEAARGNIDALHVRGLDVQAINVSHMSSSEMGEWDLQPAELENVLPDSNINIIHINPDQLHIFRESKGMPSLGGYYNIGVWAWETLKFPEEWFDRFALLDEIWVGGSIMAKAISAVSPVPVVHVPHVVKVPQMQPDRKRFGIAADETVFLFMFDFFSTTARKNPQAVIESFRKAFTPNDPVRLFMKSMNGTNKEEFAALQETARGMKVTFLDQALDGNERYVLVASCDIFVSLHRAEGFGLCIAEAMAMGKPVIATGWSGNMDFMDVNNSLPVRFELKELKEDCLPYRAGTLWAEADTDHAAELMRKLWQDKELAGRLGSRARHDIEKNFSPEVIGEKMAARLSLVDRGRQTKLQVSDGTSTTPPGVWDPEYMLARYKLLKMLRRGQITWQDFLDSSGGYGGISTFTAMLPGYWATRTAKRFHKSVSKRISKQ
ncbi:MAG: glycosyltransferase [Limisphaerales bacterium]